MVAVVSIPTVHLRNFVEGLRIRPRAKPVEDCFGQSLHFDLQVGVCDEHRAQRRACIPTANRNSLVHFRFNRSRRDQLRAPTTTPMHSRLNSHFNHENKQRTGSQWVLMGRRKGERTAAVDRGWPHQVAVTGDRLHRSHGRFMQDPGIQRSRALPRAGDAKWPSCRRHRCCDRAGRGSQRSEKQQIGISRGVRPGNMCTTAYDVLRHCGVELSKRDFMSTPVNP